MEDVLKADIFFFVTTIAVVIFTILVCVFLYFLIKVIKSIRRITEKVEEGTEVVAEDLAEIRRFIKGGGFISQILGVLFGSGTFARPRKRAKNKEDNEE